MTVSDLTSSMHSSNNRDMQHGSRANSGNTSQRERHFFSLFVTLLLLFVGFSSAIGAGPATQSPIGAIPAEPETFGTDTPLGRFSYLAGRGLRLGKTGLTIGGFTTAEMEHLEDGERSGGIEELNFLISFDPVPFAHLFTELGVDSLANVERGRRGIRSNPSLNVERLYLDLGDRDALRLRFGKFRTPIGRWNLAPRDPLLWTTSEPIIVEEVFDETSTGAMLHGSVFPQGGALSYSLYGTFLPPLDAESDEHPVRRSAGAHLEWASLKGWTLGASYFASQRRNGEWNHLGGADLLWFPHRRVELSSEIVFGEGSINDGTMWGLYAQAVVETLPSLYLVGRYEHVRPPGGGRDINLFDLGFAWVPVPYLRFKADYLIADHFNEFSSPGFRMSLSLLF
jgi:hypothetical protein